MRCHICRQAETQPGSATVTLVRGALTLVIRHVPARVCPNCGEEYVEEAIAARLLITAEQSAWYNEQQCMLFRCARLAHTASQNEAER